MKSFFATAAVVGLAAAMPKNATTTGEVVWTTEVVTAYTTYCPAPTTVVMNNKTHTVTEATTLTITDCPCTITKPHTPIATATDCDTTTGPKPTGPAQDECAAMCYDAWTKCKTAPGANQSYCSSEVNKCLGFNWAGSTEKPTACSHGVASPTGNKPTGPSKPTGTNPPTVENGAAAVAPFGLAAALAAVAML